MEEHNVMAEWWKIWKYTLGSFSDKDTEGYDDIIAILRTGIVMINLICAVVIIINIIIG